MIWSIFLDSLRILVDPRFFGYIFGYLIIFVGSLIAFQQGEFNYSEFSKTKRFWLWLVINNLIIGLLTIYFTEIFFLHKLNMSDFTGTKYAMPFLLSQVTGITMIFGLHFAPGIRFIVVNAVGFNFIVSIITFLMCFNQPNSEIFVQFLSKGVLPKFFLVILFYIVGICVLYILQMIGSIILKFILSDNFEIAEQYVNVSLSSAIGIYTYFIYLAAIQYNLLNLTKTIH